jgi:hypothetical protein
MTDTIPPAVPEGLGSAGTGLWTRTVGEFTDLAVHEEALLLQLCRTADALEELQQVLDRDGVLNTATQGVRVHPALPELRQQRITFAKLIAALKLPAAEDTPGAAGQHHGPRGVYGITGAVS